MNVFDRITQRWYTSEEARLQARKERRKDLRRERRQRKRPYIPTVEEADACCRERNQKDRAAWDREREA